MSTSVGAMTLALLLGCPQHEGPIDVVLHEDIDEEAAIIEWAEAGDSGFQVCENKPTSPDAVVACGPYGVGKPGTYVVRVEYAGVVVDKKVKVVKDRDYQANTEVFFDLAEFEPL